MNCRQLFPVVALWISSQAAAGQAPTAFVADLHCVGGPYGLSLPKDLRVLKQMSAVLREETEEVEQWDGYTATRKTLHFDGMRLGIIEFSNEPARYAVTSADLTKVDWNRISPFKLGRPGADAAARLGAAAKGDPELRRTYLSESDSVELKLSAGVLTRITYACYSG